MARIVLDNVTKVFADGTHAVRSLDLEVEDGKLIVLVGPSGCGKTTALRMVAGLEEITDGEVRIGERVVNRWRRRIATSRWCSRTTPCIRTCPCSRTWRSG
jgi:ABC-type sugar transport system ATPase subunit